MASLGPYLRDLRERRGLSFEEMARATRVATRYLEALEADDYRSLPAPAFTKGFIRAWCQAVGADPAEALARYQEHAEKHHAGLPAPRAADGEGEAQAQAKSGSRSTVLVSFVLLVVLGLALFAVTLVLQSGRDRGERHADTEQPRVSAAPSASPGDMARATTSPHEAAAAARESQVPAPRRAEPDERPQASTAPPTAAPPPVTTAPPAPARLPVTTPPAGPTSRSPTAPPATTSPSVPAASGADTAALDGVTSPYRLVARVTDPTWIRVRTGDGRLTEETIAAGEVREWVSNGPFELTVGNAGGVTLELNGRLLPPLGARGTVIPRLVIPPTGQ